MDKADADAERLRNQIIHNATEAVRAAQAFMATGDLPAAERWIARAHRLAPADSTVQLLYAGITVHSDPAEALRVLGALLARLPWHREAAIALPAALLSARQPAAAADALAAMLGRMTPPGTDMAATVAGAVCGEAGRPGWIGLDGAGHCRIALAPGGKGGTVRLTMDGAAAGAVRLRPGQAARLALPPGWRRARTLEAALGGRALIGSPLCPARFAALDGFVAAEADGSASGWARLAADPDTPPALFARCGDGAPEPVELRPAPAPEPDAEDSRPRWLFTLPPAGFLSVADAEGRDLWGSPLWPAAERDAARAAAGRLARGGTDPSPDPFRPLPAALLPGTPPRAASPRRTKRRPPCDVIVPVHGGLAELDRCLRTLAQTLPATSRLVLVDDGSPGPDIAGRLAAAAWPGVVVLTHPSALGFPAAVNAGLAHLRSAGAAQVRDVLLLNADTAVDGPWLDRLSAVLHSDPAIGSCTPLTNDGTIVSYPEPGKPSPMPDAAGLAALSALCWAANGLGAVPVPTGVGFCMMLKGACLAETGVLRTDVFAQGYGEENDWCLRAAHLGWRHVAAPGVFVGHSGGRSFGAAKALLLERNAAVLERLHPGYAAFVAGALAAEPLLPARRRIDRLRLEQAPGAAATVLITHGAGGGVDRHVAGRCAALATESRRAVVLAPTKDGRCGLSLGDERLPNLAFRLPREGAELQAVLAGAAVDAAEIHHLLGHDPSVAGLPARLGVPYDVFVHDYALWCPRITLTSRSQRYCGEPLSVTECEECVADLGSRYGDGVTVAGLRRDSAALLAGARRVFVACEDASGRIRRQFPGVRPEITAWEAPVAERPAPRRTAHASSEVHVVVAGAIGIEKGYDVLLGCARDAARRALPLRFTVVGHTIDDERLAATGRAFVTGRFAEGDGVELIRRQGAVLGFVPSVWPETWCYALSALFEAGLPVVAFGLGAQGERIGRAGRGWLLPPGIPATKVNDALVRFGLEIVQSRSDLPGGRHFDGH